MEERPPPARVFLVRHGETTWNREHRIQGQSDPSLSADGRRQAELLAGRLAGRRFSAFYSSDLKRAFETAQRLAGVIGSAPRPDEALREIFLGEWEGLTTEEIAERYPEAWERWKKEPDWDLVPGGEGAARFEARVASAMDRIVGHDHRGDVLVVTHGGVIQIALHRVFGRQGRGLFAFRIQNASISVLEKRDGRTVIARVNDVAHLEFNE
ncbi:MAG TPA: histidine phosphatase family protein [Candidatus Dormibacteraeota bacterium]|nr:histidine phosphatase family protein [Candidatus Dormibacteraeota bacterium]